MTKSCFCEALVVTVGCSSLEPAGPKSFLRVELNMSHASSRDGEPKPPALLCSVLQALAIQGDLQHKFKLFSKSQTLYSLLKSVFIPLSHLIPINMKLAPLYFFFFKTCDHHVLSRMFSSLKTVTEGIFFFLHFFAAVYCHSSADDCIYTYVNQNLFSTGFYHRHPGQVLLKNMLKPLVMYPSLSVSVTEQQDEGIVLALHCLEESNKERSAPSQVYSKLLLVLKTLHAYLLGTVRLGSYRNDKLCYKAVTQ